MRRVLCIGDPITFGVRSTRGYPEHLWDILNHDMVAPVSCTVHNAGLASGCLVDVLRALPASLALQPTWTVAVLLAPPYDARGGGTPPREFGALLEQAAHALSEGASRVILCSPTPIGESDTRGFARPSRRWIPKAAELVRDLAKAYQIPFVALHEMPRELLADAVHPKPAGYRWIADQLAPVVRVGLG